MTLWNNHLLINAVIAWITAQVLKVIIYALVNRKLDIRRLVGDGGMPSGHSATVTALAVTAGLECGLDSATFAISAILAIIVMHDAMGVRLEAGKHAKALNELLELASSDLENEVKLKEFVGHTPLQVAFGCLLGFVLAVILS
ncbi:divergent PAP2 family protein [Oscillibacter sp.]|uniref:divergent PAP2 family protein n=1 Tax=Oscillibacter sp. TaxID=1945593 RepID=UPI0028A1CB36|nr:divergent PAP2 family protein [Oscillibacter sp.]